MGALSSARRGLPFVVLIAAGTLAGCASWSFDRGHELQDDRSESATVREISLAGGDGAVTVERGPDTVVRIHREVWYRGSRPTTRQDRIEGTTLVLDTRCGRNCSVSYVVRVPTAVNVTGHLDTGPIELSDVDSVTVESNDGSIGIRSATGNVVVRTDTGPIRLDSIAGTVAARTADGAITVSRGAKAVSAQTDTGPITVTDVAGPVEVRTVDGGIGLDRIGGTVSAVTDTGPIRGTGLGGTRTLARTSDGPITLTLTTPQDVDARTGTGPIALSVPAFDGGYQVHTRTDTGPTRVNITANPAGARSLTLNSEDGAITVDPV